LRVRSTNTLAIAALIEQALCLSGKTWKGGGNTEGGQTDAGHRQILQILQAREQFEKTARAAT
jgi:hypothetical protein